MAAVTTMPSSVSIADKEISTGKVLASRRRPASAMPAPIGRVRGSATYPARGVGGAGGIWDQDLNPLADKFRTLVAEQPLRLGVDQDDPAVGGYAHHRVRSRFQERGGHAVGQQHRRYRWGHISYCISDSR